MPRTSSWMANPLLNKVREPFGNGSGFDEDDDADENGDGVERDGDNADRHVITGREKLRQIQPYVQQADDNETTGRQADKSQSSASEDSMSDIFGRGCFERRVLMPATAGSTDDGQPMADCGGFIGLLLLIPNPAGARIAIVCCGTRRRNRHGASRGGKAPTSRRGSRGRT